MLAMLETSCRVLSRSNLRSFLASLRVALTARLFSFRSGVRFAITKEYQHFRVSADFARFAGWCLTQGFPCADACVATNRHTERME
jgi:hypothetical protein